MRILYINNTFKSFAINWWKRKRPVALNTFFVFFFLCVCMRAFVFMSEHIDAFTFFHSDWKIPRIRPHLKIILKGLQINLSHNLGISHVDFIVTISII